MTLCVYLAVKAASRNFVVLAHQMLLNTKVQTFFFLPESVQNLIQLVCGRDDVSLPFDFSWHAVSGVKLDAPPTFSA